MSPGTEPRAAVFAAVRAVLPASLPFLILAEGKRSRGMLAVPWLTIDRQPAAPVGAFPSLLAIAQLPHKQSVSPHHLHLRRLRSNLSGMKALVNQADKTWTEELNDLRQLGTRCNDEPRIGIQPRITVVALSLFLLNRIPTSLCLPKNRCIFPSFFSFRPFAAIGEALSAAVFGLHGMWHRPFAWPLAFPNEPRALAQRFFLFPESRLG